MWIWTTDSYSLRVCLLNFSTLLGWKWNTNYVYVAEQMISAFESQQIRTSVDHDNSPDWKSCLDYVNVWVDPKEVDSLFPQSNIIADMLS